MLDILLWLAMFFGLGASDADIPPEIKSTGVDTCVIFNLTELHKHE